MSKILETIDQSTNLVGENRLELLLFTIDSDQLYAINVFKIREIIKLPKVSFIPGSHSQILGEVIIRDMTVPVIDLKAAIGFGPQQVTNKSNLIVTEYNRSIQGFLVDKVEKIINLSWNEISSPPKSAGQHHYLNAITQIEENDQKALISIIDVEKVLAEIIGSAYELDANIIDNEIVKHMQGANIVVVDDSATARSQIKKILKPLGFNIIEASNGMEGLKLAMNLADKDKLSSDNLLLMIVDAEMPEMDGYKLTHELRLDKRFKNVFIVLHTSLSGHFNLAMAEKVGYNKLISKFQPNELVNMIQNRIRTNLEEAHE